MILIDCLAQVADPRSRQGQRYALRPLLLMILMSMICGKYQYREIVRFCENNYQYLKKRLKLTWNKGPSHVTFRGLILNLDFVSLQSSFHAWTKEYVKIEDGEWLSIDGKAIKSTVSDYSTSYQDFVSLVSVFSQKREQVLHVEKLQNKKSDEGKVVETLLGVLDLKGVIFTMDALHCKKNSRRDCSERKSLCCEGER